METRADTVLATALALGLHLLALFAIWFGRDWQRDVEQDAAGPVIAATLEFTSADVQAAQAAIAEAVAAAPPPPPPQPLQETPQAPLERPDEIDQDAVSLLGEEPSEETEEQEARNTQEQVDLTEDIERQEEAENRQREIERQLAEIRKLREEAADVTRMEEQRLQQLADARPTAPAPREGAAEPTTAGQGGIDVGLKARYIAALNTTARDNWNTGLAPERVRCKVRFQQRPGGEVYNDVEFIDCPYDAQGRESVERALRKTPMPYSGFETVFEPRVVLTFCHPEEACQ
jgi:colicin import membrane protein